MNKKKEREIIEYPLSDNEIKFYLPNANVMRYSDLSKYSSIEELLPTNKSYAVILYENSKNKGHWVSIMRYNDKKKGDIIEFFDSLADDGKPDSELKWNNSQTNKMLGQGIPILTNLLNNCNLPVIYNKFKFQSQGNKKDGNNINCCGRHVCFRIKNLLDCDRNLEDYYDFMKNIKKDSKNTYDEVVSHLIGGEACL